MSDAIFRGEGLTASEQRLAALSDRTFLRLWSYPNTFNDRTRKSNGGGQEVADLFAVFENHVFIFSDKEIGWQAEKPIGIAWKRWYRRAVDGGVIQLLGAQRWLKLQPERIFTDKACTQRLPIPLPDEATRIVHLIAVVSGAEAATRKYFSDDRGTLVIHSGVKGDDHTDIDRKEFQPFTVGDVNPLGSFIHVFDPVGLNIVMTELDTVSDFSAYLVARAKFLRSDWPVIALGEEHLLAAYMMNGYIDGVPGFLAKSVKKKARRKLIILPEGEYETYTSSQLYVEIAQLKSSSKLWDNLIELISDDVLKGTSISILDKEPSVALSEQSLRVMASERRIDRVSLSTNLRGAMERCLDEDMARFVRRVIINRRLPSRKVGYVFLILPHNPDQGAYEAYRTYRSLMLQTYCLSLFQEHLGLDMVVGLAFDVFRRDGEIRTRSEDVIVMAPPEWTPEGLEILHQNRKAFGFKDASELQISGSTLKIKNQFSTSARRIVPQ